MDDVFTVQQAQTLDQRLGEPLDQIEAEALVVVFLNQLVQVEAETKHTRFDVNWPRLATGNYNANLMSSNVMHRWFLK